MATTPFKVRQCVLTTIRTSSKTKFRDGQIVRIVGDPRAGRPMTLFGPDGLRIVTTPVDEVQPDEYGLGMYVSTSNSVYYLERVDAGGMMRAA